MLNPSVVSQSKQSYVNQLYHSWKRVDGWLKTQEIIKNEGSQIKMGSLEIETPIKKLLWMGLLTISIGSSTRKNNTEEL